MRSVKWAAMAAVGAAAALSVFGVRAADERHATTPRSVDSAPGWPAVAPTVSRIAFGSCLEQNRAQPIWNAVHDAEPDVFVFLGDNVYADTSDMKVLQRCYDQLARSPGFQRLRQNSTVLATWDDHDYGKNDVGGGWRAKRESQKIFTEFWDADRPDSPRRTRDGVYDAQVFGPEGRRVQVILLDTRFFKMGDSGDSRGTLLGDAQWTWLEEQLRVPADVRIIASSIQFVTHGFGRESWGQFPLDRERLLRAISESKAEGVVVISGDRHHAELSLMHAGERSEGEPDGPLPAYPIYDITSSSLNKGKLAVLGGNRHRIGKAFPKANFGLIEIDWASLDPVLTIEVRDVDGKARIKREIPLSELRG